MRFLYVGHARIHAHTRAYVVKCNERKQATFERNPKIDGDHAASPTTQDQRGTHRKGLTKFEHFALTIYAAKCGNTQSIDWTAREELYAAQACNEATILIKAILDRQKELEGNRKSEPQTPPPEIPGNQRAF